MNFAYWLQRWNETAFYYYFLVNTTYLALTVVSFFAVRRHLQRSSLVDDKLLFKYAAFMKPVSIISPAFNEELSVVENVRSLLNLNYPVYEVILVNDGSKDGTLARLLEAYHLERVEHTPSETLPIKPIRGIYKSRQYRNLLVLDKENGGKADALNAGINYSRHPLYMAIDTDSLLERDVMLKMVRPFLERPETVAVGGIVRAINSCLVRDGEVVHAQLPRNPLAAMQVMEYLRAFLFGRVGWAALEMLVVISGAFGMFRRDAVVSAGGYKKTVGEDMELVLRLHRVMRERGQPYHVAFSPEPVCWTEVPESLTVLGRQRNRWARGQMDSIRMNLRMLFNPAYGRIGLIAMPYALIVEGLGAFVEVFGMGIFLGSWAAGLLDGPFVLAFLSVSVLYGTALSLSSLVLEEISFHRYPDLRSVLMLFLYGLLENFGYHQLSVWWRMRGVVDFFRGKQGWGVIPRRGFSSPADK
ncbi:MAG: glycosyltransferase family 2 protein [Deltaproteobacteria bacterium]|nr:glycosyltransferase family 2 protein [Deltaproteobacteria bacterium]